MTEKFDPNYTPLYDHACSVDLPHLDYSVGWPAMFQEQERRARIAEEKLKIAVDVIYSIYRQQSNNWVDYQDVIKKIEQVGK
jgi:hypothetical protein